MTGKFTIEYKPSAAKFIEKLRNRRLQIQLLSTVEQIAQNPYGNEKLSGGENLYRARTGQYRIIYTIINTRMIMLVLRIGHRREIYRNLY